MVKPPGNGHGALALVGDVRGRAEEGAGGGDSALVLLAAADEEKDVAAALGVPPKAKASWGAHSRVALGLPVKEDR